MREGFVAAVDADQSTLHGQSAPVLLPPAPIAPKSEWPLTVHLKYKAIRGIKPGEMLSELVFREPTAADILRYGDPVYFSTSGDARFDEPKMTQMMAALSGVFPPLIETMHPRDWNTCAYKLRNFFLPSLEAWE